MKTLIIGAGRGRRLEYLTNSEPKTFTQIRNKRILDWILQAHSANDIRDIVYIGGYLIDTIKHAYPHFTFRHNTNWENNNILQSLFYAAEDMNDAFICSYADILYTPDVVQKLLSSTADITLAIDTDWLARYQFRSQHPTTDAEKVMVHNGKLTRLHRSISDKQAFGEFIGVAKFSRDGAAVFKAAYEALDPAFQFENTIPQQRAYLLHFLNYLVEQGVRMEYVTTHGKYIEVDTLEDYVYANTYWQP